MQNSLAQNVFAIKIVTYDHFFPPIKFVLKKSIYLFCSGCEERERQEIDLHPVSPFIILCFFVPNWINFSVRPCVVYPEVAFIGMVQLRKTKKC